MTLFTEEPAPDHLLAAFEEEREVEYDGERYLVRDNGAVFRRNKYRQKKRPLDAGWTFGRKTLTTGYMLIAGVPVHRIVCTAFAGPPPVPTHIVDHIDTNRANNRPDNLRWLSRLENVLLNPISVRRIILVYGSLDAFFENPQRVNSDASYPDVSWMRTVSKDEAAASRKRLMKWVGSDTQLRGGVLGEWLYGTSVETTRKGEPEIFESLTLSAAQIKWRVPTEFPACPGAVSDDGLEEYGKALSFGDVFAQNPYSKSLVVQHGMADDGLVVLTRFAGDSIKDWAVAHVSMQGELFYHRSEYTFFELQGALKHFCELTGQSYGDAFDDYC
ncbi:HNH endonuclease [Rhizobium leguminosarum bv. trifolii CB782]|nr:HNH endonuclease [Rhizobium leguminosarum bv. trifolii CB782]